MGERLSPQPGGIWEPSQYSTSWALYGGQALHQASVATLLHRQLHGEHWTYFAFSDPQISYL